MGTTAMAARRGRLKSCFICAHVGTDTSSLRACLESMGIRWVDTTCLPRAGSILEGVERAMGATDFACAVVADELSPNIALEIGLARGMGLPLFLLLGPTANAPSDLGGFFYVRVDPHDRAALEQHLSTFLQHAAARPKRDGGLAPAGGLKRTKVAWARKALEDFVPSGGPDSVAALVGIVARLLQQAGAIVYRAPHLVEQGVDLACWIDDLEGTVGNPVPVEVKAPVASAQQLFVWLQQARVRVSRAKASLGVLVYVGPPSLARTALGISGLPVVMAVSAVDLVELIGRGDFAQELLRRRNAAVHGVDR